MPNPRSLARLLFCLSSLLILAPTSSGAADAPQPTSDERRLFLSFAEDAVVVSNQWWEGRIEFADFGRSDFALLRGVAAFRPIERLEIGGTVGFGSADGPAGYPDGSGPTDLDVWGKWHFGAVAKDLDLVAGGVVTIPTGDDAAGLGYDAFSIEGFAGVRYRMPSMILSASLGFRANGDGQTVGSDLTGRTQAILGAGLVYPISDRVAILGEARMESERFRGTDSDFRLLGGVSWRPMNRMIVRAAVGAGLTDGAPDAQVLAGIAYGF